MMERRERTRGAAALCSAREQSDPDPSVLRVSDRLALTPVCSKVKFAVQEQLCAAYVWIPVIKIKFSFHTGCLDNN